MKTYVVVAGGAGEIGSKIVRRFVTDDDNVIVADIDSEKGGTLAEEYKGKVLFYKVDFLKSSSISSLEEYIEAENIEVSHIVSVAGGALKEEFKGFEKSEDDIIYRSIALNLTSHIIIVKHLLDILKASSESNKSITFISSINAKMDFGLPAYSAAKSGLLGITKVLSSELGKYGIRVNTILPGTILTKSTLKEPKDLDTYKRGSLLGRFATAEEIAEVVYCLSKKLSCITGQEIIADCGQTVKGHYLNEEHGKLYY